MSVSLLVRGIVSCCNTCEQNITLDWTRRNYLRIHSTEEFEAELWVEIVNDFISNHGILAWIEQLSYAPYIFVFPSISRIILDAFLSVRHFAALGETSRCCQSYKVLHVCINSPRSISEATVTKHLIIFQASNICANVIRLFRYHTIAFDMNVTVGAPRFYSHYAFWYSVQEQTQLSCSSSKHAATLVQY